AIKDLDIPRDATIVAVVRSEHVVMPRGDTIFEAGDEVLAMVTGDSEDEVRRILTGGWLDGGVSAVGGWLTAPCDVPLLHELVHRVVHHALLAVACDDAFEVHAPARRDPEDLAAPEEHRGEHGVAVGDRCLERVGACTRHDADRAHFAGDAHRSALLDLVER